MFEKLKRKSIEIICPSCKGGQTEPSLAFSTYCRTCGTHLKIIKGIARVNAGPQLSGISSIRIVSDKTPAFHIGSDRKEIEPGGTNGNHTESSDGWVKSKSKPEKAKDRKKGKRQRARERVLDLEETGDSEAEPERDDDRYGPEEYVENEIMASVAEVFGLTQPKTGNANEASPWKDEFEEDYQLGEGSITLGNEAASYEELTEGSMAAMIGDLVEQEEKREQAKAEQIARAFPPPPEKKSGPNVSEPKPEPAVLAPEDKPIVTKKEVSKNQIKVRCFRCNHRQWESKYAESTQCGRCNTYISLADYHIRQPTDRVIRTRGNVTVHRRGSLLGSELACRDLLAMGTISTKIDCSGEARFRYSATVNGNLHCESLIVEKGTIVEFTEGVYSESVKIYGTLRGDVVCAGLVEVTKTGILDGDVQARAMDLQDGGTLTGEMTIDPELKVKLPAVRGYDPSIID